MQLWSQLQGRVKPGPLYTYDTKVLHIHPMSLLTLRDRVFRSMYRCKNCNNPSGKRQHQSHTPRRIVRQRHVWQRRLNKSALFAKEFAEDVCKGPCTSLEYLIIAEIYKYCLRSFSSDVKLVTIIYTAVLEYSESLSLDLPLGAKTEDDILKTVSEYHHNLKVFQALTETQLQINTIGQAEADTN